MQKDHGRVGDAPLPGFDELEALCSSARAVVELCDLLRFKALKDEVTKDLELTGPGVDGAWILPEEL
jgi:hypothetical protein